MSREEFRQQAAISALQAVVEAKGGLVMEVDVNLAAKLSVRLADSLTEQYFGKEDGQE